MKRILVFIDWFTPAYRAGGPIKSIYNFANLLSTNYEIYVYTSDRDFGMKTSFEKIHLNDWVNVAPNIHVLYNTPKYQTTANIKKAIIDVMPSYIYINSMYSKHFSIDVLLLKNSFKDVKFIVAPRGMLKKSALAFKPVKKKLFLTLAKVKGFYNNVYFHATDATEANDIKRHVQRDASVIEEVGNCPAKPEVEFQYITKKANDLNIIFIGRIHPIKNLHYLLQVLQPVKSKVNLSIVGVLEDKMYWEECEKIIKNLPANIKVTFFNEMHPFELENFIKEHHTLVLPTKGENFGHAIYECLAIARPVIISDQTPWLNLEKHDAGWDLPLNNPKAFTEKIEYLASLNQFDYNILCYGAIQLANEFYDNPQIKEKYLKLFS